MASDRRPWQMWNILNEGLRERQESNENLLARIHAAQQAEQATRRYEAQSKSADARNERNALEITARSLMGRLSDQGIRVTKPLPDTPEGLRAFITELMNMGATAFEENVQGTMQQLRSAQAQMDAIELRYAANAEAQATDTATNMLLQQTEPDSKVRARFYELMAANGNKLGRVLPILQWEMTNDKRATTAVGMALNTYTSVKETAMEGIRNDPNFRRWSQIYNDASTSQEGPRATRLLNQERAKELERAAALARPKGTGAKVVPVPAGNVTPAEQERYGFGVPAELRAVADGTKGTGEAAVVLAPVRTAIPSSGAHDVLAVAEGLKNAGSWLMNVPNVPGARSGQPALAGTNGTNEAAGAMALEPVALPQTSPMFDPTGLSLAPLPAPTAVPSNAPVNLPPWLLPANQTLPPGTSLPSWLLPSAPANPYDEALARVLLMNPQLPPARPAPPPLPASLAPWPGRLPPGMATEAWGRSQTNLPPVLPAPMMPLR